MSESPESASEHAATRGDYPGWDVMVLLVIVAVLPASFATGFSQFEHLKEWVLVGGVGLAAALWAVRVAFADKIRVEAARIAGLGLAFAAYALVSVMWSASWAVGLSEALPVAAGFVAFWIAMSGEHRPTFGEFSMAVALGVLGGGVLGGLDWLGVSVFSVVWDPPGATGPFDGMEFAAAYYTVALPVLASAAVRLSGLKRGITAVALGVGALHFGATASWMLITLLVTAVVGSGVLAAFFQPDEAEVLTPAAGGVIAILLAGIVIGHSQYGVPEGMETATSVPLLSQTESAQQESVQQNRPWNPIFSIGRMETVDSNETRRYLATVGYSLFMDRAFMGHGAGAWWRLQTKHVLPDHPAVQQRFRQYPAYRSPHNAIVHVAVEYGLIGSVLLLLWLVSACGLTLKAIGREPEPYDVVIEQWGLVAAAVAGGAAACVTAFWSVSPALLTWMVALAVLLRISDEMTESQEGTVGWGLTPQSQGGWTAGRVSAFTIAGIVAAGFITASTLQGTARLYRGYADHAMLYTAYQRAAKLYDRVGNWWPKPGDVYYNQALAERRSVGGAQDVGSLVERAASVRPHDARVLTENAQYALSQGNMSVATRFGYRAVDAYPNSFHARSVLSTALQRSDRPSEAASQLVAFLDREPPTDIEIDVRRNLASLYMTLGEPQNAKDHLNRALDMAEERGTRQAIRAELEKIEQKLKQEKRREEGKPPKKKGQQLPGVGPK